MGVVTPIGDKLLENGPPPLFQGRPNLTGSGRHNIILRAGLAILLGWLPLVLLVAFQGGAALSIGAGAAATPDYAVHARFLVAAPLLIIAEAIGLPRLDDIARHFISAQLVRPDEDDRFQAAWASTRKLLHSPLARILLWATAYLATAGLMFSIPASELPAWTLPNAGWRAFSPAGWWHLLVSLPMLVGLLFGWLWRVCLWMRFLGLVSRMNLELIPAHPDQAAGLLFVGYSVRAFSIVAFALAAIAAGRLANVAVHDDVLSMPHVAEVVGGTAVISILLFIGPLCVFSDDLLRAWLRGVFEYGELAGDLGRRFERKWLASRAARDGLLHAEDFSATVDLYSVVAIVYRMRFIPVDRASVAALLAAVLLPFAPVSLLVVPPSEILGFVKKLLI